MIWRERRILLIVLGVLLAANTIFFFTYRVQYETRLRDLDDRRDLADAQLTQARSSRMFAERRVAAYRQIQRDVADIYTNRWATEGERLTAFIAEVQRLAAVSELVPPTIAFGKTSRDRKLGVDAETVTINFSVRGTYQQVRRLISLLELSRQFVIIDQISLSSADDKGQLTLNLQLKTLFRDTRPAGKES